MFEFSKFLLFRFSPVFKMFFRKFSNFASCTRVQQWQKSQPTCKKWEDKLSLIIRVFCRRWRRNKAKVFISKILKNTPNDQTFSTPKLSLILHVKNGKKDLKIFQQYLFCFSDYLCAASTHATSLLVETVKCHSDQQNILSTQHKLIRT